MEVLKLQLEVTRLPTLSTSDGK